MTGRGLWRSVRDDLRRHWRHVAAGGLGITVSVAALFFFLALGLGVREVLLGDVFSLDRFEVVRATTDLNLLALKLELGSDILDDPTIAELAAIDGVAAVYPKMRLLVPAVASGGESLIGVGMQTELVADGIDPAQVVDEVGGGFHDPLLDPSVDGSPCTGPGGCPSGSTCVGASNFGPGECREIIPVIVSDHMVELYNGAFRRAYRLPKINPEALVGFGLEVGFGASSLGSSARRIVRHRVEFVGTSEAAIPLGITMPLGFVRELNRTLGPPSAGDGFHSAVIEVEAEGAAAGVIAAIESHGLVVRDGGARRAAYLTSMLLAVVGLLGAVVLGISALHVMHVFSLLVVIRRREIGVMRALGASRLDVRALLVAESAVVGVIAGAVGVAGARLFAWMTDRALASGVPDFPFKPESFFAFEPWLAPAAVALAIAACVVGALGPALRATAADPSEIIAGD